MMIFSTLLSTMLTIGCGEDPILQKANTQSSSEKAQSTSTKTTPTVAPPPSEEPVAKSVTEVPKVAPPAVAPPKEPAQDEVPPPPPNPKDGDFVTFTGKIDASNPNNRPIRIDIFDGDQQNIGGKRPSVVVSTTLESGTSFEIFLPRTDQQLWVGAYIDENEDGRPGPMDPSGWYSGNPISGDQDQESIVIQLGIPNDAPP